MAIIALEHSIGEDPGCMLQWAEERGEPVWEVRLDLDEQLPDKELVSMLIIMGGPMNIYEDKKYPWLITEKKYISDIISSGRPVLGICLGSQLISDVLGGTVTQAKNPEFGWHQVQKVRENREINPEIFPDTLGVFQWHGDTFSIPPGASHLYSSPTCTDQGFVYQKKVIGLQFHPEMTVTTINTFLTHFTDDSDPKMQNLKEEIKHSLHLCDEGNRFIRGVLEYLINLR